MQNIARKQNITARKLETQKNVKHAITKTLYPHKLKIYLLRHLNIRQTFTAIHKQQKMLKTPNLQHKSQLITIQTDRRPTKIYADTKNVKTLQQISLQPQFTSHNHTNRQYPQKPTEK